MKIQSFLKLLIVSKIICLMMIVTGCAYQRMNETAEKLDASREALRSCLSANQSKPEACAAQRETFEMDLQVYNARAAAINAARRGASSYASSNYAASGAANAAAQNAMMGAAAAQESAIRAMSALTAPGGAFGPGTMGNPIYIQQEP